MDLLHIHGPEQSLIDPNLPDGGLPPLAGVQSVQIFRASRDVPEMTDGRGWTYHHHVDMACWKGRLYVGWNSCERDEDVWPSRELFSTSIDGENWSSPAELFPQGTSTALRMYFFHAPNGRMLAIAGRRFDQSDTDEDKKGALVAREIRADHTLGPVFHLNPPDEIDSPDDALRTASRQLLAASLFLEQQDRGRLLGARRMKWHDASAWPGGKVPGDNEKWVAGKAFSFFQRPDGAWVGVSKMGWTTFSHDGGETWSQPVVPPTLITGKAKVWSQRTADGRFALVYNPSRANRFPLIAVTGDDGVNFDSMRIIQGKLPIQRYEGLHRSIGPQYVRGISHWADDGSRLENVMWLTYSMNKEDIWVSRVPLPMRDYGPSWITYSPAWASVKTDTDQLEMTNSDPHDYPQATRIFPESAGVDLSFELSTGDSGRSHLEIDLLSKFGSRRAVRALIEPASSMTAVRITADATEKKFAVGIGGKTTQHGFFESVDKLQRMTIRAGPFRGIGGLHPVAPGTDKPAQPVRYRLQRIVQK
jgi:hypothetical protein